ncbi:MAG: hypothetical protein MJ107_02065 [Lachnospiraceae bacterium]|nr:hypothetical protein [Lachnospiraceae bacterium]
MDHKICLIGSDMNTYYMARCYHEAFKEPIDVIATEPIRFTQFSSIVNITYHPDLKEDEGFVNAMLEYGKANFTGEKILAIPCHDVYVRLLVENAEKISEYFVFNSPNLKIVNAFLVKETFYKAFSKAGLKFAKTLYYNCSEEKTEPIPKDMYYPLIIKPSNGIEYNRHHFAGQPKVFKATTPDNAVEFINRVKASGYKDTLIVQEFIPGDDSYLFDCVFYVNTKGKAELASFAQIGLQEHSPSAIGNCTVLMNGYNAFGKTKETVEELKNFLEGIGYNGFAEFDLKYDRRDNTFKVMEINPRQARSSYYLCALGHNLITTLVDDVFEGKEKEFELLEDKVLLSMVPKSVLKKYVLNDDYKAEALKLWKEHKKVDPLKYKGEKSFKHKLYLILRATNYKKKYKKNKNTI